MPRTAKELKERLTAMQQKTPQEREQTFRLREAFNALKHNAIKEKRERNERLATEKKQELVDVALLDQYAEENKREELQYLIYQLLHFQTRATNYLDPQVLRLRQLLYAPHSDLKELAQVARAVIEQAKITPVIKAAPPPTTLNTQTPRPPHWTGEGWTETRHDESDIITISHGGGYFHLLEFLTGSSPGYRLESPGIGIQVSPDEAAHIRDYEYAHMHALPWFDQPAKLVARIKVENVDEARNAYEAGLRQEFIDLLEDVRLEKFSDINRFAPLLEGRESPELRVLTERVNGLFDNLVGLWSIYRTDEDRRNTVLEMLSLIHQSHIPFTEWVNCNENIALYVTQFPDITLAEGIRQNNPELIQLYLNSEEFNKMKVEEKAALLETAINKVLEKPESNCLPILLAREVQSCFTTTQRAQIQEAVQRAMQKAVDENNLPVITRLLNVEPMHFNFAIEATLRRGDAILLGQLLNLDKDQKMLWRPNDRAFLTAIITQCPPEARQGCFDVFMASTRTSTCKELVTATLAFTDDPTILKKIFSARRDLENLELIELATQALQNGRINSFNFLLQVEDQYIPVLNEKRSAAEINLFDQALAHPDPAFFKSLSKKFPTHFHEQLYTPLIQRATMHFAQNPTDPRNQLRLSRLLEFEPPPNALQVYNQARLISLAHAAGIKLPVEVFKQLGQSDSPASKTATAKFLCESMPSYSPITTDKLDSLVRSTYHYFLDQMTDIAQRYNLPVLQKKLQEYKMEGPAEKCSPRTLSQRLADLEKIMAQYGSTGKAGMITFFDKAIEESHKKRCAEFKSAMTEFRKLEDALQENTSAAASTPRVR